MAIVRIICKRDLPTQSLTPSQSSPLSSLRVTSGPPSTVPSEQPKTPTQSHSLKLFNGFLLYRSQRVSPLPNSGFPRLPTPSLPLDPPSLELLRLPCLPHNVFIFASPLTILFPPSGRSPLLLCWANSCFPFTAQFGHHHFLQEAFSDHHPHWNKLLSGDYTY